MCIAQVFVARICWLGRRYDLTLTLLDAFRTQETTSEAATRMDVLYKSFQLKIVDANYSACNSPCPKYSMVLTPLLMASVLTG